ncbi:MAG: hypothetical protein JWQ87_3722 [Candidatus Sulfotelmatobacter sp.]|nr:hypothetical protein [Candidatus Sulfotelmatobacter sp.]
MQSELRASFDAIPFRIKFDKGRQTVCDPLCPNCDQVLDKQVERGQDAMLMCPRQNKGCANPVKRFGTEQEMDQFLATACKAFDTRKT